MRKLRKFLADWAECLIYKTPDGSFFVYADGMGNVMWIENGL